MIGKISMGKSFKGCINYCLNDKIQEPEKELVMRNRAEILLFNQCYGSAQELIKQFNEVRQLNPRLSKPVLHITLSLSPGEKLPNDKLMDMCRDCALDMGFENNQFIAVAHLDTAHPHLHIVANRIGYDRRTVIDSQNFQKIAKYCRRMELKYGLKQVLSPRAYLSKAERLMPRQDSRKEKLKSDILQTLQKVKIYGEFEEKMKSLGYEVMKGRGIAFIDQKKVRIKGSDAGFSLKKIEKILALKQELENTPKMERLVEGINLKRPNPQDLKRLSSASEKITRKHYPVKHEEISQTITLQKQITNLLFEVLKPGQMDGQLPHELLKQSKKKKGLGKHF